MLILVQKYMVLDKLNMWTNRQPSLSLLSQGVQESITFGIYDKGMKMFEIEMSLITATSTSTTKKLMKKGNER